MSKLRDGLGHPLTLAFATALFSSVLATGVVRLWQNHDKSLDIQRVHAEQELDLMNRLVRDVGSSSARFLGAIASTGDRRSVGNAYRVFLVDSTLVASQLAAYFPTPLAVLWTNYSYDLRNVYYLLTSPPGSARDLWLFRVSRYLRIKPIDIDGLCFPAETNGQPDLNYQEDMRELTLRLQRREAVIVEQVVATGSVLR